MTEEANGPPAAELGTEQEQVVGKVPEADEPKPLQPYPDPEIVFGLIGPVGVDLAPVVNALSEFLEGEGIYTVDTIRLSDEIADFFKVSFKGQPEHVRVRHLMHLGTELRRTSNRGDAVALLGVQAIQAVRQDVRDGCFTKHAYILRSLKTPDEIRTLRSVYGKGFYAISVYTPRETRVSVLAERISRSRHGETVRSRALAERLVEIDELEERSLGQDVQDAFPMADLFVYTHNADELRKQIRRFVSLIFGNRFFTPTRDEHGMQIARSAALRSSDMNRQVGAAIANDEGDLLAIGCNDVPKAHGGFYWPEDPIDQRDFKRGKDSMAIHREQVLAEMLARLKRADMLAPKAQDIDKLVKSLVSGEDKPVLKGTAGMSILEFGRSVHAEMAALTTAARLGVPVKGATLFCTTFPCHICARHIVAAGIKRVIYVEPYPKSKAKQLHDDAISVDPQSPSSSLVNFEPFQGIAPGKYMELFEASDLRKDEHGAVPNWNMSTATPRFTRFLNTYSDIENLVTGGLLADIRTLQFDAKMPVEPAFQEPK
jgi:deoxycytidylate deaminase